MTPPAKIIPESNHCIYEERFATLERENAELKARMDNKKEDIHDINKELAVDRQQQIELIEKVTEVTVLLKASQEQRELSAKANAEKFKDLEKKMDDMQEELSATKDALKETREQLTDFVASQRSFRSTVVIGVPIIISLIVGVGMKFL